MSALLIGFLLVVASAGAFGFALFGRRPVPQPATAGMPVHRGYLPGAENRPRGRRSDTSEPSSGTNPTMPAAAGVHLSAADVRPSPARRIRAAAILAISIVGAAVLVGAVLSVLAVGVVLIIS